MSELVTVIERVKTTRGYRRGNALKVRIEDAIPMIEAGDAWANGCPVGVVPEEWKAAESSRPKKKKAVDEEAVEKNGEN